MTILKDNSTTISGQIVSNNAVYSNPAHSNPVHSNPWVPQNGNIAISASNGQISSSLKIPEIEVINDRLARIEKQLAILTPDLVKLEKFAALKQAYDNYVLIENLCKDQP